MRILITGASGFIGSFLVEHALSLGMETWAAMRSTSSRRYLQDSRTRFIELDLSDDARLHEQLAAQTAAHGAFDAVVHAAGATQCRRAEDFFKINTEGTHRLARQLMETGALRPDGRFVFISSLSVWGPASERNLRPITTTDTPVPDTAYGLSKLKAENCLSQVEGLNYIILRPTGVYGPRERDYYLMARSIARHIDFAAGFKPQMITFIYVRDLVQAVFLALEKGESGHGYFLSDGGRYTSRTFSDLLQMEMGVRRVAHIVAPLWLLRAICALGGCVARLTRRRVTLNPDKYRIMRQRNWLCDIRPAREELGYKPEWPLTRGVHETVAWYKANGWL